MKKACKHCRMLVDGSLCTGCKGNDFSTTWNGKIIILDAEKSSVAKKLEISVDGEYALKVR